MRTVPRSLLLNLRRTARWCELQLMARDGLPAVSVFGQIIDVLPGGRVRIASMVFQTVQDVAVRDVELVLGEKDRVLWRR